MHGGNGAAVPRIQKLKQVERFAAANLAQDNAVGSRTTSERGWSPRSCPDASLSLSLNSSSERRRC